jgi:hypothetical protein
MDTPKVYKIELWCWFQRRFQACYANFLDGFGFDTVKFDSDVLKYSYHTESYPEGTKGKCALDVCEEKYGKIARKFLQAACSFANVPDAKPPLISLPSGNSIIEFDPSKPDSLIEINYCLQFDHIDKDRRDYLKESGWKQA